MSNGRNATKPMGFEEAAQALTQSLSPEATRRLIALVKAVAHQYSYNDSRMLKALRERLDRAARKGQWAQEVLAELNRRKARGVAA